jgi:hypothetical protein
MGYVGVIVHRLNGWDGFALIFFGSLTLTCDGCNSKCRSILGSAFPSFSGMYQRQISNPTFNPAVMR